MADRMRSLRVVAGRGPISGTSDFKDNLASRMTRLACFMRLRRAIEGKCIYTHMGKLP
jgi:hypothetical protein